MGPEFDDLRGRIAGSVLALSSQTPGTEVDLRAGGAAAWRTDLRRLHRAGFRSVDLVDGWLPLPLLSAAELADLGGALDDAGLVARGLNVSRRSVLDPELGERNVEYSIRAVDAAASLGLPLVSIGLHPRLRPDQKGVLWFWEVPSTPDDTSEATWDLAATRMRAVCAHAATQGIEVSLELYEDTLVRTGADIARLVERVGAANLGVNPDLGNTYRSATPQHEHWLATLRGAIPHMDYWHLKNYTRSTLGPDGPFAVSPTALGEGDIDYRLAIGEALRGGYRGPFVVEHYGGDALDVQRRGREYLERLLDELAEDLAQESAAPVAGPVDESGAPL